MNKKEKIKIQIETAREIKRLEEERETENGYYNSIHSADVESYIEKKEKELFNIS